MLDVGGMKFRKGGYSRDFTVNESNPFDLMVFNGVDNLQEMDAKIDSLIRFDADWNEKEHRGEYYYHNLPTAISVQAGYMIWKDFMVDVTGIVNLVSKKNDSRVRIANQITITPSYDFAWASVHIPISYNSYSGFKAGIGTRLGPITIGITDFKSLFATGELRGAEIYAGLRLPILYGEPRDRDNDNKVGHNPCSAYLHIRHLSQHDLCRTSICNTYSIHKDNRHHIPDSHRHTHSAIHHSRRRFTQESLQAAMDYDARLFHSLGNPILCSDNPGDTGSDKKERST